jgi:hypothetical protein
MQAVGSRHVRYHLVDVGKHGCLVLGFKALQALLYQLL